MRTTEQNEYIVPVDDKQRIRLKSKKKLAKFYEVKLLKDGEILLSPKVFASPNEVLSRETLQMIDSSMKNLKKGKVSKPVDFSKFGDIVSNEDE